MAVGRISGQLLKGNLLRDGVDLAFETDLLYLDVNNNRVGINNANPQYDIDVNGTTRTTTLEVTNFADIADINITGNTISTSGSTIVLGTADNVIYQNRAVIDSINIEGNTVSTTDSNANLEFRPDGTGTVEVHSSMNVQGNIYATGDIIADGTITIGDEDTDYVQFNSQVNSDIIPAQDGTYSLGNNGSLWQDIYVDNFFAGVIDTTGLEVDGITLTLRQGNIWYVSENGDDTFTGDHPQDPYASLAKALSEAQSGDTIHITPGVYTEVFPLTIPQGVTVKGESLRSVKIVPTLATNTNDAFLLNAESSIEEVTVANFFYDSLNDTGYGFRFANGINVTSRSPYIRNISVITQGSTLSGSDPRGFDAGDAGRGAFFDGSVVAPTSREAGILFHAVTFITPGVDAVTFTNGVRVEWLNCFTYFADKAVHCLDGATGKAGQGQTALRVSDVTGSFAAGQVVTYYDTDGVTVLAQGTINNITDGKIFINGKVLGFAEPDSRIGKQVVVNGNAGLDDTIKKFGTSSLALHTTGDYINVLPQNDFGFSTGDFTVETWVYFDGLTGTQTIFDFRAALDSDIAPVVQAVGNDAVYFTDNAAKITISNVFTATETWYHVAISRNGTDTKLFVNGTPGTTYTDNNDYGVAKPLAIGSKYGGAEVVNGNLDDFRVIKGDAYYTSAFTPPNINLYATPQTVLLLRFNGDDSSTVIEDEVIYEQDIRFSGGATATKINLADYTDFGAEVRMIGSACVYGNYGLYGNGPGVIVYAIGQNLAYIGTGKKVDNDVTDVIQPNEVIQLNGARIRYNSVDHRGDFRVGDLFYVNQEDGTVTFTSANFNVQADQGFTFTDGVNTTIINAEKIDTGNLRVSGNTIETLSGDLEFTSASDQINLNNNVTVDGNLDVTGNLTLGGNLTIGDEATDSIEFIAGIDSDILPSKTSTYNLGSLALQWKNIYANQADIDDIRIKTNYITTTVSNSNLELRANGTGFIVIDELSFDDITISSTSNINIESDTSYVKVNTTGAIKLPTGTTLERPASESGLIRFNTQLNRFEGYDGSDWIQLNGVVDLDGDTRITGELTQGANDNIIRMDISGETIVDINSLRLNAPRITVDDIEIDTNVITTITTNTDLKLSAQGTGSVLLENFAFDENTITNTVLDSVTEFVNTGDGYVKVTGTNGFVIPVGDNTNRPKPAFTETGMMRFNTADGRVEAFDGNQWGSVAGATGAITTIDAGYLAVETALFLG